MDEIQFRHEGKPHKEHHQVFGFNCQNCLTGTNRNLDFIFIKMRMRMKMMVRTGATLEMRVRGQKEGMTVVVRS